MELQAQVAPLKAERLRLQGEINRLTFESVIAPAPDPKGLGKPLGSLADLEARIAPLQAQINQLTRQFWVTREQVKANNYDLSASRYRQVEPDEAYYEKPQVTMERLLELEQVIEEEIQDLEEMLR